MKVVKFSDYKNKSQKEAEQGFKQIAEPLMKGKKASIDNLLHETIKKLSKD